VTDARAESGHDDVVLGLAGVTKRFGTVVALDDVSLRLRRGTVHALLGENGAGKTTLMRIAFGLIGPDAGTVRAADSTRSISSTVEAIAAGVGMVHQHFTNVPAMTVAENVALGGHGLYHARRAADVVAKIGARTGLPLDPQSRVASLPVGAQQRLEIVKALARRARILILDEPTAVLAPSEGGELLRWLRSFANDGNAVVLITHKLHEALAISDDLTVLRRGRVVLQATARDATTRSVAAALLGEEPPRPESRERPAVARTAGVVARLVDADVMDDGGARTICGASIDVRGGEIVGIAAVEGAGQRELIRALAARAPVSRGEAILPRAIGFIPEDRQRDALVLEQTLTENVALKDAGSRRGVIQWTRERRRTRRLIEVFDVRGGGVNRIADSLSGGNQQKLVLARELDGSPPLLVAENPTRGLDIRATQTVHDRLREVAAAGGAVVVYSSDLDEVLALATRVVVVHAGRLRECPLDRDVVGRAMLGVT
jgi:simple sugar transport system ATP-binding protein